MDTASERMTTAADDRRPGENWLVYLDRRFSQGFFVFLHRVLMLGALKAVASVHGLTPTTKYVLNYMSLFGAVLLIEPIHRALRTAIIDPMASRFPGAIKAHRTWRGVSIGLALAVTVGLVFYINHVIFQLTEAVSQVGEPNVASPKAGSPPAAQPGSSR